MPSPSGAWRAVLYLTHDLTEKMFDLMSHWHGGEPRLLEEAASLAEQRAWIIEFASVGDKQPFRDALADAAAVQAEALRALIKVITESGPTASDPVTIAREREVLSAFTGAIRAQAETLKLAAAVDRGQPVN